MSLYKRGGIWWIRFTAPDGRELRETAQTADRRQAQEYHDRRKAECWRVAKLGERPRYSWRQAVVQWLEVHPERRNDSILSYLRHADTFFGELSLAQIDQARLTEALHTYRRSGVKNSTANNLIMIIRAILHFVQRLGWIDTVPSVEYLPVTDRRIRWLTRDQADRLLEALPSLLKPMVRFSLATGLRKMNVALLEWNQVDLERRTAWVHADQAKGRRIITIPLNTDAIVVLREQQGKHPNWVFVSNDGHPVKRPIASGWYPAVKRAGLDGFRWHDLRHTWASWHVQAGTPLAVLKELGGWATLDMVLRYAHLAPDHLAEHAERISGPRLVRTKSGTEVENMPVTAKKR